MNPKLRDLATAAINSLIKHGVPILSRERINETIELSLYGKRTIIRCEASDTGFFHGVVYVGWGPLDFVTDMSKADIIEFDVHLMVYFERERCFAIEGEDIYDTFSLVHISPVGEEMLRQLPLVFPLGFKRHCVIQNSCLFFN